MIVSLEGIDASGKQTQAKALLKYFESKTETTAIKKVQLHDFPHYQTIAGSCVGRILRGETLIVNENDVDRDMSPTSMAQLWSKDKATIIQCVMVADRLEHLHLLAEFALSPHNLLILDRYKFSGIAYGIADGLDKSWLKLVQSPLPDADLNVLLNISAEESYRRRPDRRDYYERNLKKLETVSQVYKDEFLEGGLSSDSQSTFAIVPGKQDPEIITQQIVEAIWREMHFRQGLSPSDDFMMLI